MTRRPGTIITPDAAAAATIAVALALAGCASGPFDTRYFYEPRPDDVHVRFVDETSTGRGQVLVSVRGIRRADRETGASPSVEVLWQVSSLDGQPLTMRAESLRLTAANLEQFPPPRLEPAVDVTVSPGASETIRARFPFPEDSYPGSFDLSGLNLRWSVESDGRVLHGSSTFRRARIYYSYPSRYYEHPYRYDTFRGPIRYRYYPCD
ncbi:MAG: hypothetical protein ACYTGG_04105 [Planctomycetota bacterium]|jgi:hypothetical protein